MDSYQSLLNIFFLFPGPFLVLSHVVFRYKGSLQFGEGAVIAYFFIVTKCTKKQWHGSVGTFEMLGTLGGWFK